MTPVVHGENQAPHREMVVADLYETAARATINERCASAFLHDVRGTMQVLFSAFELLGRSAKAGGGDPLRIEKACDLARRAIRHHEQSTMNVLQILTLLPTAAAVVDVAELVTEVAHFLRNDAAIKRVTVGVSSTADSSISVERAKFHTLLVGLMTAAIDETPAGVELHVSVGRGGDEAIISIGSGAGFGNTPALDEYAEQPSPPLHARALIALFAHHYLAAHGGRFVVDSAEPPRGAMHLYFPCQDGARHPRDSADVPQPADTPSFAESRVSLSAK